MEAKVYNQQGQETGKVKLPEEIFALPMNRDLLHQVVTGQLANRRATIAHTKDRGEVSGGGRKPWRQKGTGRARHGSIRSPLWRGGGITFGPTKEKGYQQKVNKKMKRKALFISLSDKAQNNGLIVLDKLVLEAPKTKQMIEVMTNLAKALNRKFGVMLMILCGADKNVERASRNIARTRVLRADSLNAKDILASECLLVTKQALEEVKKTYGVIG